MKVRPKTSCSLGVMVFGVVVGVIERPERSIAESLGSNESGAERLLVDWSRRCLCCVSKHLECVRDAPKAFLAVARPSDIRNEDAILTPRPISRQGREDVGMVERDQSTMAHRVRYILRILSRAWKFKNCYSHFRRSRRRIVPRST